MKRFLCTFLVLAFVWSVAPLANAQQTAAIPRFTGMVNDYANVIDDATQARLEQRLRNLQSGTNPSVEIGVLTIPTTDGRELQEFATEVARSWGIGSKQDDNPGALLVLAVNDRRYFTVTSRDASADLTDGVVGQYQRQYLRPALVAGDYSKGVNDVVEAYIKLLGERRGFDPNTLERREAVAAPTTAPETERSSSPFGKFCMILFIIFIVLLFISISNRNNRGGGGGYGGRRRGGGVVIPPVIWWGGGGFGGGGSSSGGDSWGGFGGGGDFDGGGAGGDW